MNMTTLGLHVSSLRLVAACNCVRTSATYINITNRNVHYEAQSRVTPEDVLGGYDVVCEIT